MKELPIYAYKRPEEMDHPCAEPHPVVVVGAGVTGLTMAPAARNSATQSASAAGRCPRKCAARRPC